MATNNAINTEFPIDVPSGGTGVASLTDHGVLVGSGTGAVTVLSVGTDGQLLIGATGADPAFATVTSSGGTVSFTTGANTLNIEAAVTPLAWSEITAATKTIVVNEGYIANRGTLITFTLPATASVGDEFAIAGIGAGGWKVAQNASQYIILEGSTSTVGVGGSLDSADASDCVEVICTVTNVGFTVRNGAGSPTVT
jgi:hypothetical protein